LPEHAPAAAVRSFWSGTLTFGLVSIPVDFYAAARPRQKSLKLVDAEGHPLGRQYTREDEDRPLAGDELIRGFETEDGKMIVVTEQELESAAPETSRDIDLYRFVPAEQIPPSYFVRPYFLTPGNRSAKAYTLLAQTMERTGKVGIGRLVMRGHEYLVAIIAEKGALRAETLRYSDELRTPDYIGLPAVTAPPKRTVQAFEKAIDGHMAHQLTLHELEDQEAEALQALAESKRKKDDDVIALSGAEDEEPEEGSPQVVDLVELLRRSLGSSPAPAGSAAKTAARVAPAPTPSRAPARTRASKAAPKSKAVPTSKAAPQATAGKPAPAPKAAASADLEIRTREELYQMASERDIAGRSKMSKAQLLKALQRA
jgi:DNA end-binding protein Ku